MLLATLKLNLNKFHLLFFLPHVFILYHDAIQHTFILDVLCIRTLQLSPQQVGVEPDINPAPDPPISRKLAITSVIRRL